LWKNRRKTPAERILVELKGNWKKGHKKKELKKSASKQIREE